MMLLAYILQVLMHGHRRHLCLCYRCWLLPASRPEQRSRHNSLTRHCHKAPNSLRGYASDRPDGATTESLLSNASDDRSLILAVSQFLHFGLGFNIVQVTVTLYASELHGKNSNSLSCVTWKWHQMCTIHGGPKKLRQIFLAITLVNMDWF